MKELDPVATKVAIKNNHFDYPIGTKGIIVHCYGNGDVFLIEVFNPPNVLFVHKTMIEGPNEWMKDQI